MVNPAERTAADQASEPYFVLAAWRPELEPMSQDPATAGQAERFLSDWQRRCLPLPLCSAPSQLVYEAYRLWCELQAVAKPSAPKDFGTSVRRAGIHNARHLIRMPRASKCSQHAVLHPSGARLKSGSALDRSVAAFGAALAGWRLAVGQLSRTSAATPTEGRE